ncbi:MAG: hypothetical protein IKC90_04855 [Akkermansia sp.]|nr:hypothetical protein [Akkermansia sp.]MBR7109349.1 hypothetical protein [Akkermansia sp.]
MKQFLLIPTSALVAAVALTSCQKEELSCTQLATELTTLLQNVTDFDTAEAAAPRAEALMKRLVAAMGRPAGLGGSALHSSSLDEGKALQDALDKLSEQLARINSSYPSLTSDGEIDTERLKRAVGAAGATKRAEAAAELKKGEAYIAKYMKKNVSFDKDANNGVNGFAPCFGSTKLKDALDFREDPETSIWKFDGEADVIATPEYVAPAEGEAAAPAEGDTAEDGADEPAETDTTDEGDAEEPAADDSEEPAADDSEETTEDEDSGDIDVDVDVSVDVDDEEPAVEEETTDEEPAVEEETTDEEPAEEEETTDEEPAEEEESTEEDSGDDVDLDIGDLDI